MPSAPEDDAAIRATSVELLRLARDGDRDALNALFERLFPPLRRWTRGRLPTWARSITDSADLVQEAMLNAFRRLDHVEVRRKGALQAYLRTSIDNRIRDELRRASRRPAQDVADTSTPDGQPSPLDVAMDAELRIRYVAALARLKRADQQLIVGRIDLVYNYEQLALATGRRSAGAARLAVRRAVLRLADEMSRE